MGVWRQRKVSIPRIPELREPIAVQSLEDQVGLGLNESEKQFKMRLLT